VTSDPAVLARLTRYLVLLLERNATLNLTAARDPAAAAEHVRDSLEIAPHLQDPFVDIGSGGGFPAIPLAIATGFRATLIESLAKKARFLADVARELDLPVTIRTGRAEDAARDPQLRERFAGATARAVGSAPTVIELTVPFLALGGLAVLQRGRLDMAERAAAADAAMIVGSTLEEEVRVGAGRGEERRVLLVRKVAPTASRFPRRTGVPLKRPLCFAGRDA